jgi:hypothetical protein
MFKNNGKKYALLLGNTYDNTLKSCKSDIYILEKILKTENYIIKTVCDSYPEKEITDFIRDIKLNEEDLLYVHFSGHGKLYGKKLDGKVRLISSWVNPDGTLFYSCDLKRIFDSLHIKRIILTCDCCHGETFGEFNGKSEFIFLGTSNISGIARSYSHDNLGAIAYIFHYFFLNTIELNIENLKKYKIIPVSLIIKFNNLLFFHKTI